MSLYQSKVKYSGINNKWVNEGHAPASLELASLCANGAQCDNSAGGH